MKATETHWSPGQRRFWRTVSAVGALVCAVSTPAKAADDQFVFSDDRSSVRVEVHDMPRGEVLRRLLDVARADVKSSNPWLEKSITGNFDGRIADVVRQVLRGTNFTIFYTGMDTIARVIVLGESGKDAAVAPTVYFVQRVGILPATPPPPPPPPQQATLAAAPTSYDGKAKQSHDTVQRHSATMRHLRRYRYPHRSRHQAEEHIFNDLDGNKIAARRDLSPPI